MTGNATGLLPGKVVLVDTDRTCRKLPMRGLRAVIHDTWRDEHTGRDYVIVCLEGHQRPGDCAWSCRMPLLRVDEVIAVPAATTDAGYLTTAIAICIFGVLLFLAVLTAGQHAMCATHHDQLRYCAHYQETSAR